MWRQSNASSNSGGTDLMRMTSWLGVTALVTILLTQPARAAIVITEWMYNPASGNGEFFELTNTGPAPVNMTGWSFDDNSNAAGSFSLSGFGTINVGESVLVTEIAEAAFRTEWSLAPSVRILGSSTQNLSRDDQINIYDATNVRVDRLTYNDQGTGMVDGPRTQGISGNPPTLAVLGADNASAWVLSAANDSYGSVTSTAANIGNPGKFTLIPEPGALTLVGIATAGLTAIRRRRRAA
jgi:predicted extracellular nuclease